MSKESLIGMLNDIGLSASQPPKEGYAKRAINLYVEDECDAGGEFILSYVLTLDDVKVLLFALGGWLPRTSSEMATAAIPSETAMPMWLVEFDGNPAAAYPRKVQAEVYGSGFSNPEAIKIIEGKFVAGGERGSEVK